MVNENRVNELYSHISSFNKESYTKSELLSELFELQKELADLTINEKNRLSKNEKTKIDEKIKDTNNDDIRYWHIRDMLRNMNNECNNVAYYELEKVERGLNVLINKTKGLISGIKGEQQCRHALEDISCRHEVIYNVELEFDGTRKEIDAIVITNQCIFLIEVKNSKKNIFIDEKGNFIRTGSNLHFDCNIGKKMNERETLLRKAIEKTGINHVKIYKILVFTNPYIDVENKYHKIKICTCKQLPCLIDGFISCQRYTNEEICTMTAAINEAKCLEEYKMSINMEEFKNDFSILLAKLEEYKKAENRPETIQTDKKCVKKDFNSIKILKATDKLEKISTATFIGFPFLKIGIISATLILKIVKKAKYIK